MARHLASVSCPKGWACAEHSRLGQEVFRHRDIRLKYPQVRVIGFDEERLARSVEAVGAHKDELTLPQRRAFGCALARLGRLQEALEQFDLVVKVDPGDELAIHNRAMVLAGLSRTEEAAKVLAPLAAAPRPHPGVLAAYGDVLTTMGRRDEAAAAYERGRRLSGGDTWFLHRLTTLEGREGSGPDPVAELRRAARSGDGWALIRLGEALLHEGLLQEAYEVSDRLLPRRDESDNVLLFRAQVLTAMGERDQALECVLAVMADSPASARTQIAAANVLGDLGNHEEAVRAADRACALAPGDVRILMLAGRLFYIAGRFEQSVRRLDQAIILDPGNYLLYEAKAAALQRLERSAEALQAVETGLSKEPGQPRLLKLKADLLAGRRGR